MAAVGEADRRADRDPDPSRICAASATAYGLMQTLATPYRAASRQPSSSSAPPRVGPSSEWSIRLAIAS